MKITNDKVVALTYELEVEGQIVDKTTDGKTLDYIQGAGTLLQNFEQNLEGKEPGDRFDFVLTPEEGYGEVDPERIIDLPMQIFEVDGKLLDEFLHAGAMVPLVNSQGQMVPGKVLEVGKDTVKVDLNSPMAGKTLHFTGEVKSVREATEKELHEGLHGEYVHSNCGCNGGCGGHHHDHEEGCCCGGDHEGQDGCCGGHHEEGCCGGHHDHEGGCCCGD